LICADTHKDEILDKAGALKPELLLVPYGYAAVENDWPAHGKELEKVVRNAAKRTGAVVVGTNAVGQISKGHWKGRVYGGQSIAADKNAKTIARAKDRDRDTVVVCIEGGGE